MKTKWFIYLVVALFSFSFVACGDDDEGGTRDNPSTASDPAGTIVANLANNSTVTFSVSESYGSKPQIRLNSSNNLSMYNSEIVSVGSVNGLSSINKVPENGWSKEVAAIPGYGYIIQWRKSSSTYGYVRLYVVDWMTSTTGGIMGCTVKYQEWTPANK